MSKLITCKACGKEIAKGVKKCVHCGKDQRNFFMKHKIITGILVIIILVSIGKAIGGDSSTKDNSTTASTTEKSESKTNTKKEEKKYSLSKFMQITMGMSYDQVKGILGDGVEEVSSEAGGIKTISYSWKNTDGSNISVMFQGNQAITKAQAFLESMNAKVTLEQYNKVNNGMSYDEVKAILGDGQLISQSSMLGIESQIYSWINSNGSNMNVTFQGGKVETKAQINLK